MAQVDLGDRSIPTDVRVWDDETRREASLVVLGLAGALLLGALLYFGLDAAGSVWFLWVAIVFLVILFLLEAAILATGIAREEGGPEWLAGPGAQATASTTQAPEPSQPPASAPAEQEHVHIDLKCPSCGDLFSVHDTGDRPLHTQCPHCGAEGHVDLPPLEEEEASGAPAGSAELASDQAVSDPGEPADEPATQAEPVSLKCPACETQFEVEDDGTRPLEAVCPGCGRGGKLK